MNRDMLRGFVLAIVASLAIGASAYRYVVVEDPDGDPIQVVLDGGVRKLAVLATTIVEQIFGKDLRPSSFFFFGASLEDADGIGAATETVRIQIPAAPSPINAIYPAVDYTYTITAADVADDNPERRVALNFCSGFKLDSNSIAARWTCTVARDFAYIFLQSRLFNEFGSRTSYTVTCSGATICNLGESDIVQRGKETELSPSPNDPARAGVLAIQGSVSVLPGELSDQFEAHFQDNNNSIDMNVDGSSTPEYFFIWCDDEKDQFITEVRIAGVDNTVVKYGQFLGIPTLANGIELEIRSDDTVSEFTEHSIKSTEGLLFHVSDPITNFRLDNQPGFNIGLAARSYDNPFPIRQCGTTVVDDYIVAIIQDNLTSLMGFYMFARGFRKEP